MRMRAWAPTVLVALAMASVCGEGTDRVAKASQRTLPTLTRAVEAAGFTYPPRHLLLRAFKDERELEVWASMGEEYVLIDTYSIASSSGDLGPKRKEGDRQVPEGVYTVDRFNPKSAYHLSLGINHPNASDVVRSDRKRPGSDIFIHGGRVSIGCLAMTDGVIEEVYTLVWDSRLKYHEIAPVHIFPARLEPGVLDRLAKGANRQHEVFWRELEPIYDAFERTHRLPKVRIERNGRYTVLSNEPK